MARCKMRNARPKAPLGTAIAVGSLAANLLGQGIGLWNNRKQQQAQAEAMQRELDMQKRQLNLQNLNNQASALNNGVLSQQYDEPKYYEYANGGRVPGSRIKITDGGYAVQTRPHTYLLQGGSHEDMNESGQYGIGARIGGKNIEVEGGESIVEFPGFDFIFSNNPELTMPNGKTPSENVQAGGDPSLTARWQEAFKKHYGLNDNGTMKKNKLRSVISIDRPRADLGTILPFANAGVGILGSILSRTTGNSSYKRQGEYLADFEKTLNGMSPYFGSGFVAGPTNYRNDQAWRTLRQNLNTNLNNNFRNTASSNVALSNANQIIEAGNTEAEKIRQDELDKNFEARMKNAEMYNQHNDAIAQMVNNFMMQKGQLQADFLGKRLDVANSRYSDNTAMWQGIINSVGDLSQWYVDKQADKLNRQMIYAMSNNKGLRRLADMGVLDKDGYLSAYNSALSTYNADPTKENANEVNWWSNMANSKWNKWAMRKGINTVAVPQPNVALSAPTVNLNRYGVSNYSNSLSRYLHPQYYNANFTAPGIDANRYVYNNLYNRNKKGLYYSLGLR